VRIRETLCNIEKDSRIAGKVLLVSLLFLLAVASTMVYAPQSRAASGSGGADRHGDLRRLMEDLTNGTNKHTAAALTGGLLLLGRHEEFEAGQVLLLSLAGSSAVTGALKYVVNRRRPTPPNDRKNSSFPSGHATASFATAAVLSHYYPRLSIPLYVLAGAISYSRLYLDRHYGSDVIAGALIGIVSARVVLSHRRRLTIRGRGLVGAFLTRDGAGLTLAF